MPFYHEIELAPSRRPRPKLDALLRRYRAEMLYAVPDTANGVQPPLCTLSRLDEAVGQRIPTAADTLPADQVAILQERGRARDLEITAAQLLTELDT